MGSAAALHMVFDIAAWLAAGAAGLWLTRGRRIRFPAASFTLPYLAALVIGAAVGAYGFGSANLWLSGQAGLARSIEGALAGAVAAIELYKQAHGIRLRTGARFALPIAVGIAIGRIGCYAAGLEDFTYGTPTSLPWGHDFGDGVPRHPVQLYESAAMAGFCGWYVIALFRQSSIVVRDGFYLMLAFYGAQRFVWEFFKPYAALAGPFTLFHLLSLAILLYAAAMLATAPAAEFKHDRAVA